MIFCETALEILGYFYFKYFVGLYIQLQVNTVLQITYCTVRRYYCGLYPLLGNND
jgi:hypothetical protein